MWPLLVPVTVTRGFLFADSLYIMGHHYAIDIVRTPPNSTHLADVIAPGDGEAMAAPSLDHYRGLLVTWRGPNGWRMQVAHMADFVIPRGVWVPVVQGQALGHADNTGVSLGSHAHIDWLNPAKMSSEAVWKAPFNAYAHDVSKWINVDIGWEDDLPLNDDDKQAVTDILINVLRAPEFDIGNMRNDVKAIKAQPPGLTEAQVRTIVAEELAKKI